MNGADFPCFEDWLRQRWGPLVGELEPGDLESLRASSIGAMYDLEKGKHGLLAPWNEAVEFLAEQITRIARHIAR